MAAGAKETMDNIKQLREEVFTDDVTLNKLRPDVMAASEEELFNERASWEATKAAKNMELSRKWREFYDASDISKKDQEIQISENIKNEWHEQGYQIGLAEGKRFTAVEQYHRGYYFGARNANKKTAKQNITEAFENGKQAGSKETAAKWKMEMDKAMAYTQKRLVEEVEGFYEEGVADGEDNLAERFATFLQQRESAVRRSSRAYGMCEGAATQVRYQNNIK
jgi:CRISPR/Cas system CSM-associated protein Csm2 small subunit